MSKTTADMFVDSTRHVKPDKNGYGIHDGESFEIVAVAGKFVFRTVRHYGDKNKQHEVLQRCVEAFKKVEVSIENDQE